MNEINLVGTGPKKYNEKKLRLARIASVIALFLTAISSVGLFLLNTRFSVASIKEGQTQIINQISSYDERIVKLSIINSRVLEIEQIREQNIDYTKFIQTILDMAPTEVTVNSFEIEEKKATISISSPSLLSMSDFINELLKFADKNSKENPTISKATIESLSANDRTGNFFMTVNLEIP